MTVAPAMKNYIDIAGGDLLVALYGTDDRWIATVGNPWSLPSQRH